MNNMQPLDSVHHANYTHITPDSGQYQTAYSTDYYVQTTHSIANHMSHMTIDNSTRTSNSMRPDTSINNSPVENPNSSFFVSDSIRKECIRKIAKTQEVCDVEDPSLPKKVDVYVDLLPIESMPGTNSFTFNTISSVFRATNSETGQFFCLRRFHGVTLNTVKLLMGTIESWRKIQHANIVPLRQVFTSKAFGDNSVIFVYDFYPDSETLMSCYFSNQMSNLSAHTSQILNGYSTSSRPFSQQQNTRKFLPESTIWSYIIQISSALRVVHQSNLAFRSLDPSKVLITNGWDSSAQFSNKGKNAYLRLSFCCVSDVVLHDPALYHSNNNQLIQHYQMEDLCLFGRLCLALATNCITVFSQQANSNELLNMLPRIYSSDLRSLISYLISSKNERKSIDNIMPIIGARFYTQLDQVYSRYDSTFDELAKEIDNGRLVRLMAKLGTINERYEHQLDPNWSETGDRYMLKLFRDYIFHQFDANGKPLLDLSHIISNLNKLDVGSPEKIGLTSRDTQNVIIVSFEELKRCLEAAISELIQ